jgi:anhydro-N-acetylmuramic acid kinase
MQKNRKLYIGLMSGTSADGIDLALVDFTDNNPQLVASYYQTYSTEIYNKIISLYNPADNEIDRACHLDIELAQLFSQAINTFLQQQQLSAKDITAIGNHGQTIRHRPNSPHAYTLQIGCSQTLATLTNIKVIGQFRRKDMVLGGQGAPLVPAFHRVIFQEESSPVFVVNIGGIANITYLPCNGEHILGFDTGPGNALLDDWYKKHHQQHYDHNGSWASTGKICHTLLALFLQDPYFKKKPPKSSGREYFNLDWLTKYLNTPTISTLNLPAEDIQATLTALTAKTISEQIIVLASSAKIYLCGGGIHNRYLKSLLLNELPSFDIMLTNQKGINSDSLEAMAFAWLAFAYNKKLLSNIPAVTGASKAVTLGCQFYP